MPLPILHFIRALQFKRGTLPIDKSEAQCHNLISYHHCLNWCVSGTDASTGWPWTCRQPQAWDRMPLSGCCLHGLVHSVDRRPSAVFLNALNVLHFCKALRIALCWKVLYALPSKYVVQLQGQGQPVNPNPTRVLINLCRLTLLCNPKPMIFTDSEPWKYQCADMHVSLCAQWISLFDLRPYVRNVPGTMFSRLMVTCYQD